MPTDPPPRTAWSPAPPSDVAGCRAGSVVTASAAGEAALGDLDKARLVGPECLLDGAGEVREGLHARALDAVGLSQPAALVQPPPGHGPPLAPLPQALASRLPMPHHIITVSPR